jgi:hypothetical protein
MKPTIQNLSIAHTYAAIPRNARPPQLPLRPPRGRTTSGNPLGARTSFICACIRSGILLAALLPCLHAQAVDSEPKPRYYPVHSVISPVRQIVDALGERVQAKGNERVSLTGTLTRKAGVSAIQVISEAPGFLRIDEQGGKGRSLVFDLTSLKGAAAIDDEDEGLAESLQSDTAEAFLRGFEPGSSVRFLGDRFQVKDAKGFGAELDVFEVVSAVTVRRDKRTSVKRFMFDSSSGLLHRVVYRTEQAGKTVTVQTVLSDYSSVGAHTLPGKIVRLVGDSEVFTLARTGAAVQGAGQDNAFKEPGR